MDLVGNSNSKGVRGDYMAQCDFCFRPKSPLQSPHPGLSCKVCKACIFQIERVVGFLNHYGAAVVVQPKFDTTARPVLGDKLRGRKGRGSVQPKVASILDDVKTS